MPEPEPAPEDRRYPLTLARYYQSLMDSGKFESRAALARYLGVSRPRVFEGRRSFSPYGLAHSGSQVAMPWM
jgi:hypothetical protein